MTNSNGLSDIKSNERKSPPTNQSQISIISIPQIILTEPPQSTSQLPPLHDDTNTAYPLSSSSPHNNTQTKQQNGTSNLLPTATPLPLTKDLLQRKNKLDRLLLQKEKSKRRHEQKPSMSDTYMANDVVDERVTAGLGISTPGISHGRSSSSASFGRSLDPEKSAATLFSPTVSEWSYDLDNFRPTLSESSKGDGKKSKKQQAGTSVSGSSIRNSVSMHAYSPNHRYMDTHLNNPNHPSHSYYHSRPYYRRPENPSTQTEAKSKYFLIDLLYKTAQRVVNSRAPESSHIAQLEMFNLNSSKPSASSIKETEDDEQARLPVAGEMANIAETNEKVLNPFPTTEMSTNSASSVRQSVNHKHRHSWLSFATSWDEKSDIDRSSIMEHKPEQEHNDIPETIKKPVSLPNVQPNPLQGHTLYLFGPNNPVRLFIWHFIRKRYVEASMFFLMVIHWFLLASMPITANDQKSAFGGQWTHYPILLIQIVYSIEALCKIIAYGLIIPPKEPSVKPNALNINSLWKRKDSLPATIRGSAIVTEPFKEQPPPAAIENEIEKTLYTRKHNAYLYCFGNWIDLISIGSYWVDFVLMVYGYPYLSLFKSLASMRPLRLLSILPGTAVILKSLETNWNLLLAVTGLICFFLLLFALIGLISFSGIFSRRCYFTNSDNELQLVEPARYCSGYIKDSIIVGAYNPETQESSYPGYHGFICNAGQICMEYSGNNPQNGFVNYDSIFFALLSVYTFVSMELWTDLMYISQDADSTVSALYYCLGVYIIGFVLTFLLFAVITSAFARVRADNAVSAFTAKKSGYPVLRDTEGLDDEMMWTFDNAPEDLGKGVTRLKIRWWIVRLVKKRTFFYFCGFLVFLDLIFMCLRSFASSQSTIDLVDNAETAFTFIFAIEILLRMIGAISWIGFWSSKTNLFDLFLVICTCVIQLPMIQDSPAYKYLTIFQILRCYRLFICIPRVQRLVLRALGTGESVFNVMVFLVLATALCSTIFMQMFGGDFDDVVSNTDPENRFDTFWQSFVSLIVIYTSETWTAVLYNAMSSQAGYGTIYAAIALSIYFAFGRYIMSALYIAVVLENFELSDEYIRHYQIKDFIQRHRFKDKDRTETILYKLFRPLYRSNESKQVQVTELPASLTAPLTKADITNILSDMPKKNAAKYRNARHLSWIEQKIASAFRAIRQRIPFLKKQTSVKSVPINLLSQDPDDTAMDYDAIAAEENRAAQKEDMPIVNSLFLFSETSRVRNWCRRLVGHNADGQAEKQNLFNWIVMACVLVSILMVILDEPSTRLLRKDTSKEDVYSTIEIALSIVFIIEVGIRIIADGFLLTPNAYLRNHWNQLDLSVILLNIGTIFMSYENTPRGLSTFRSLRILRLIRYFNGVRDIFVSLFYALPLMFDALVFTMLVLIPFSIYGLNIFHGLMWLCNDDSVATRGECIGEFQVNIGEDDGLEMNLWIPRVWQNPQDGFINFDDFPNALQHLFSLTSTEGWVDSMFSAMSVPDNVNMQPSFDWNSNKVYHGLFYIIFMIISQGTMQLFVGVIIEKFKERSGITTLTTPQRQYLDLQRLLASVKPTIKAFRPTSRIRRICYDIVKEKHGKFNRLMMIIIVLNILTIASEFQNEPDWLSDTQDYTYLGFTIIYVIECAIKLIGLGWKKWIQSKWNWFDFIIVTSALILLIFRFAIPDLWTLRAERYCLILAAFRLGEGIESLQTLYHTIGKSMPSIIQVSAVFMVAMCLFAMLFMEFFGLTKYGVYGTSHVNFRDYGNALLLLVRATTGEAWNALLLDYAVQYPNCNKADNYLDDDCGSPFWAYFLFNIFYIICTHIFMNLFTAVIISNFEYTYETRTRFTQITKTDLRMFKHAWADIDTRASGYIQKEDVAKLLGKLTGQFDCRIYDESMSIENIKRLMKQGRAGENNLHPFDPVHASPKSPGGKSMGSGENIEQDFNLVELNKQLDKMDREEVRKRRIEYNILYKEIIQSETPKGIPFASALTIMSYRFVDITASLTLDPLIARLEKIEQLRQEYYLEKAAGFFFAQIQKRRFVKELWKKRDEDEVKRLGVTSPNHFQFPSSNLSATESPMGYFHLSKNPKKKSPPVPRIVIDNVPANTNYSSPVSAGTNSIPVSPMSTYSVENTPLDSSYGGPAYSLIVATGTNSIPSSPNTDFGTSGGSGRSPFAGALSPYSPMAPQLSPASRQHWLLIDGNVDMSTDMSDGLMDSIQSSVWSDMLRDEDA